MGENSSPAQGELVNAVFRTMSLLEFLATHPGLGLAEIARGVNLNKSTVFRFLNTLCELGYVYKDPYTEKFELSLKLYGVLPPIARELDIKKYALTGMERLAELTGETIHLAAIEQGHLVYLHKIESRKSLRVVAMHSAIGKSAPLYCTGVGKSLMAWQPAQTVSSYLENLDFIQYTEHTIQNRHQLEQEFKTIRTIGYSVDNEEHEVGVRCIAAPIFALHGNIVAAMSISGPTVRMTDSYMAELSKLIIQTCKEVSRLLGALC
jgi:IclR family transcriptional regulator, KDG regulon repressor